jgi:hypothetical protein
MPELRSTSHGASSKNTLENSSPRPANFLPRGADWDRCFVPPLPLDDEQNASATKADTDSPNPSALSLLIPIESPP